MARKLTKNQQLYIKEIDLLKKRIKRLEKKGFTVDTISLPEIPKRITKKSIEDIHNIRGKRLLEYTEQARELKTITDYIPTFSMSSRISEELDYLLSYMNDEMKIYSLMTGKQTKIYLKSNKENLKRIWQNRLETEDAHSLETYLLENQDKIMNEISRINEGSRYAEQIEQSIVKLSTLLKGSPLSQTEAESTNIYTDLLNIYE